MPADLVSRMRGEHNWSDRRTLLSRFLFGPLTKATEICSFSGWCRWSLGASRGADCGESLVAESGGLYIAPSGDEDIRAEEFVGQADSVERAEDVERADGVAGVFVEARQNKRLIDGGGETGWSAQEAGRRRWKESKKGGKTGRAVERTKAGRGYNDGVYIHVRRRRTPTRSREMTEFATARSTLPDSEPPFCRGSVSARPRPSTPSPSTHRSASSSPALCLAVWPASPIPSMAFDARCLGTQRCGGREPELGVPRRGEGADGCTGLPGPWPPPALKRRRVPYLPPALPGYSGTVAVRA